MFCFDDQYQVETWRDGVCNTYVLKADGGDSVLSVISHETSSKEGHGTRLTVLANKNLPDPANIQATLGYRFLFDPEFCVFINKKPVEYQKKIAPTKENTITLNLPNTRGRKINSNKWHSLLGGKQANWQCILDNRKDQGGRCSQKICAKASHCC